MRKNMKKHINPVLCAVYLLLFLALSYRLFLSVELTDEIHGIASIYNIYLGKKPFMTSWDYHTGWCLLAPIFAVFRWFSPDFEGIVLFFRIVYLVFTSLCAGTILWLLYRTQKNISVWYFIAPAMCFVPMSIFQLNYNSLTSYIIMLTAALLLTSEKEKPEKLRYLFLGVMMCLGCITYPTLVVLAAVLAVWIGIRNRKNFWKEKVCFYIIGGCATALIFIIWIFSDGNIQLFSEALKGMLSSPHEQTKGMINSQFLLQTFYYPIRKYLNRGFGICVSSYLAIQLGLHFSAWTWKDFLNRILLILFLILNAWVNKGQYGYVALGILIAFIGAYPAAFGIRGRSCTTLFLLAAWILTYSFTSDNRNVMIAFEAASPLICFLSGILLYETMAEEHFSLEVVFIVLLGLSGLLNVYSYVYRDEPVTQLSQKVEVGIYKGLYTTESRKHLIQQTEKELETYIDREDSICVITRAPMVYMMAKAKICAPQTWDAQFLARGYTSAKPLLTYFEAMGEYPDILVATSLDVPDFLENDKYEIHKLIKERYESYYEKQIEGVDIFLWKSR